MEHNNPVENTLEKIKSEHIVPRPKWEFVLENIFRWALFVFCGAIGALFVVFTYNVLMDADWDMRPRLKIGLLRFLFMMLPPAWLVFSVCSIALAYIVFRSTRYGYRYSGKSSLVIVLGSVILTSMVSFFMKADKIAGNRMPSIIPGYVETAMVKEKMWSHPEDGLLSGEVVAVSKDSEFIALRDFLGENWTVSFDKNAKIPRLLMDKINGKRIKIVGKIIDDHKFQALEIRPWNDRFEREMPQHKIQSPPARRILP